MLETPEIEILDDIHSRHKATFSCSAILFCLGVEGALADVRLQ